MAYCPTETGTNKTVPAAERRQIVATAEGRGFVGGLARAPAGATESFGALRLIHYDFELRPSKWNVTLDTEQRGEVKHLLACESCLTSPVAPNSKVA